MVSIGWLKGIDAAPRDGYTLPMPKAHGAPNRAPAAPSGRRPRQRSVEEDLARLPLPFLDKFDELFDADDIWAAGRQLGAVERRRKLDLPALVEATVLSLTGPDGPQTTIMGNYFTLSGKKVAPSSFYDWFDREFAALLAELAHRAIAAVKAVESTMARPSFDGALLERLGDVKIADASCMVLRKLAASWAPSTNKKRPAGIKLHAVMSLGDRTLSSYHVTEQKRHDSRELNEAALESGTLFLYDLGYLSHEREVRLIERGVDLLRRLKDSENPRILRVIRGKADRKRCRGMRLNEALDEGALELGHPIDLEAEISARDGRTAKVRVVGVNAPNGETRYYLTTLGPDRLDTEEVPIAYGVRWEVELLFKAFKSGVGLHKILAWRKDAVLALVHAKVIAMALARLLELSAEKVAGPHATTQLAIVLTLTRMTPLLMAMRLRKRGVDLVEMERRLFLLTLTLARSRRQRRERSKREKLMKSRGTNP